MASPTLEVLRSNLTQLKSSERWLRRSFIQCSAIGIKDSYSEDEFDAFETLTARYARTVDLIVGRVLRSLDAVEFLEPGSIIDAANRAEKRGIIESVSYLRDIKDLRNEIAHEYQIDYLKSLFATVLEYIPGVFTLSGKIFEYSKRYSTE